ncbi:MAG: competence protein ComGA [Parcubacteria bacterium C7867-007]|nr:MAG: competence protein ComGA [Parcubacteria bacterium C7867-007]
MQTDIQDLLRRNPIPIVLLVDALIVSAYALRASDIHVAPGTHALLIRFRIDGHLIDAHQLPLTVHAEVIARLKILAGLRTDEHQTAQDGRFRFEQEDKLIDIRVSIAPTYTGENAVLRLLPIVATAPSLSTLGFSEAQQTLIHKALARPYGMILTTGPTGSGKTTTLYTLLTQLAKRDVSVVTIEDPVEYALEGITQIQTNERTGITFAGGLRSILRQDPDVLLVGEIRDTETARIATNAALTGHQVLSTLHANNAIAAFIRLRDLGVESYLLASTISLVIAQRLVRVNCTHCVVPMFADEATTALFDITIYMRSGGCKQCNGTGFSGRVGIFELLLVDSTIRDCIGDDDLETLLEVAIGSGSFVPLPVAGMHLVHEGITTPEEVIRHMHE